MTETEWRACPDPWRMVQFVRDAGYAAANLGCRCCRFNCAQRPGLCPAYRKLRLLAVACAGRGLQLLTDPVCAPALAEVEDVIEGHVTPPPVYTPAGITFDRVRRARFPKPPYQDDGAWNAIYCTIHRRWAALYDESFAEYRWNLVRTVLTDAADSLGADEPAEQSALVRDIFGNPFRSVACEPAWLTSTVLALAEGIYGERDFGAMPILADALQDSGCEQPDILNHCRDATRVHARGCWVLDLVLENEKEKMGEWAMI